MCDFHFKEYKIRLFEFMCYIRIYQTDKHVQNVHISWWTSDKTIDIEHVRKFTESVVYFDFISKWSIDQTYVWHTIAS
jgi:hypothetical protein